ncbi:hypothetical protein ACIREE_18475 [Streptomyces sp. NPDC102467]|uniref:hypothetical protein n=1 Tax=Streptomyces sp. NPDC102467 TaxID=3366179 RepID=UPI00381A7A1E
MTTQPHPAGQRPPVASVGDPKGVAEGVLSSVRPDPHPTTPPRHTAGSVIGWLRITTPRGAAPTATSFCACGRDINATGRTRVLALIKDHAAHRDLCPLHTPQEGRAAA